MKKNINLEEEVICGYTVTKEMKKVWQVELDLLSKFMEVCEKHNLTYFLISGSLIGVVRHQGFVPWDDDIDIGMSREDYNKLLKISQEEFKNPYFFQTPYNDKIYRGHAQLRNSNTSAILPSEIYASYNQGIFIDIFPFDEYPKTKIQRKIQKTRLHFLEKVMNSYIKPKHESLKSKVFYSLIFPFVKLFHYENVYRHYEKICSKYNGKGSNTISNIGFKYGRDKYEHPKEYFKKDMLTKAKFMNLEVVIPKEYDKILTRQYGEYMKFKTGNMHGELYLSADKPYPEYLEELRNKNEKI